MTAHPFIADSILRRLRRPAACLALAGLLAAGTAGAAPEFNVTVEPAGEAERRIGLSFLAENNVTALEFELRLDVSGSFSADVRQCLASLPKTHTGKCAVRGKTLRGVIYSRENALLGDTNIGSVVLSPGSLLKQDGSANDVNVTSVNVKAVTPGGNTVSASVRVDGQGVPAGKNGG